MLSELSFCKLVYIVHANCIHIGRSAKSRIKTIYQVPDLIREETFNYLCEKRGLTLKDAEKIFRYVGGRIVHLKIIADALANNKGLEGMHDLFWGK